MADDLPHEFGRILVGKSDIYQYLTLALGNRHGLVAGATGTGKTVTLQVLAEGFSRAGTAVFAADIKGDLAGIAMPGDSKPHLREVRRRPFCQREAARRGANPELILCFLKARP